MAVRAGGYGPTGGSSGREATARSGFDEVVGGLIWTDRCPSSTSRSIALATSRRASTNRFRMAFSFMVSSPRSGAVVSADRVVELCLDALRRRSNPGAVELAQYQPRIRFTVFDEKNVQSLRRAESAPRVGLERLSSTAWVGPGSVRRIEHRRLE